MPQDNQNLINPCTVLIKISRVPVLVILIALYLIFVGYIFPNSAYESEVGPFDLKFSYSTETAYEMLEAYGEEGRSRYARSVMTIDLAYPIVYTLMFMVWLTLVLKGSHLTPARQCALSLSPLSVFVLDLIENTGIVTLLNTYPERHETVVTATSFATSAKWSAAAIVIAITLIATVHWAWRRITSR